MSCDLATCKYYGCKSLSSIRLSENLKDISAYMFEKCEGLRFLDIPKSVKMFGEGVFRWSPIKTLIIRGTFTDELRKDTFSFMDDEVVIYVQETEMEKFQRVFSGTILPLEEYNISVINRPNINAVKSSSVYDLTGHLIPTPPTKGIFIQNGKKVMVR